ncbi:MAG: LicD family protein [Lachnospiraceae bacterium]|nr:LicD family protein [Lachnospiraceae bacterium]
MNKVAGMIPEQFYERECRDGFVVGEVMKHCWAAGLQAVSDLQDFCRAHSIRFFAAYGTLLGTVRHGGFIPWDDDIDIGMTGDDYIRFLELFPEFAGENYQIFNPYTRDWYCMNFSHIVNGRDLTFDRKNLKKRCGCPFLVGPDVYPYYYIPRNKEEEEYVLRILKKTDEAIALSRESDRRSKSEGGFAKDSRLNEALAYALVELQHETGYEFTTDRPLANQLEILYDQICRLTPPEEADYLTRYDEYVKDRSKKFPKEWLENVVELPFEYMQMPVPVVYDAILKARFGGNYMMPVQEPALHGYPFYAKQMQDVGNRIEERERSLVETQVIKTGDRCKGKTAVLFYTAIRDLLIYSAEAIDKIRQVIAYFRERQDRLFLWWVPGQFLTEEDMAMDQIAPQMKQEYEMLQIQFAEENCGICDLSGDMDHAVKECGLFYGDAGMLSEKTAKAGKKVMLQDYRKSDMDRILSEIRY